MLIASITTAIATGILAVFTGFYVFFTYRLMKETRRMVDEMTRPDVAIYFKNEKPEKTQSIYFKICFCIKNVGTHTVRKVRFEGDLAFKPQDKAIGDIRWVKNGIEVLLPSEMHSDSIYVATIPKQHSEFYDISDSKANIKVIYEDIFRGKQCFDQQLNLHEIDVYKQ